MTIRQLEYIVALDNHRHFVTAAAHCFVAQPTLTLQVKKLEDELGLAIFDRSEQPVVPTPMGEMFIAKARQILRDIDQLKELVNDDKVQLKGTFKVGIIPSLSPYLLPLFLADFSANFPETRLEIKEWQSEAIMEGLHKNMLDLGILVTPLNDATIREIPLFYEPFLVYANKNNPILDNENIHAEDLNREELWLMEKGHCFRKQALNLCAQKDDFTDNRNVMLEGGSIETLKKMVQQISGYTLIPELSFNPKADAEYTRRFTEPEPAREVSIVVHKSFTKELLLAELRKSVLKHIPANFRKNNRFITVKWR